MWLAGQPRTIFLAGGTYVLGATVTLLTDTVIIGDVTDPPIIQAAPGFQGEFLIVGGAPGYVTAGNGGELHFSVMLKNVILDTTLNAARENFVALSWRVAQNTALVNVEIRMPPAVHTGIWMGQGSALSVADTKFVNGSIGIHYAGLQQATLKNMRFEDCVTGIQIDNGFTINIFAPTFTNIANPIVLNAGDPWVSVIDAISMSSGPFFRSNVASPNFMIENVQKDTSDTPMVIIGSTTRLEGTSFVETYVVGNTYGANPIYQSDPQPRNTLRPALLAPTGRYPVITAPQYVDFTADDTINLKDTAQNGGNSLFGDGWHDDSDALQCALDTAAAADKIAYLPYGIYRVQKTITIPDGTRLVGNAWSTISGYGPYFSDESNPRPIVQVGAPDSTGHAVIQDIRFTVGQALPGAIVLQINMAGAQPGDVAVFNSLITIGGTRDTEMSCSSEATCRGAYIGLHLSPSSSAYIENFWSWLADHQADNAWGSKTRVAAKHGILVEATKGTWLVGIASEHFWLTNLFFHNAENVFTSLFQSETNYNQGATAPVRTPSPFTPTSIDPDFSWCDADPTADTTAGPDQATDSDSDLDSTTSPPTTPTVKNPNCGMTIAQYIDGGSNLFSYGSASWNFYAGSQETLNFIGENVPTNTHLYGLCDHLATWIMGFVGDGKRVGQGKVDGFAGSWGTLVAEMSFQ
jgi:hypothetical protein